MSQLFYLGPGSYFMIKKKLVTLLLFFLNNIFLDSIKSRLGPK